tara:strand:- start:357 stop:1805 length:1449 start_codon:yes stop_codon:yes gene_type:complete
MAKPITNRVKTGKTPVIRKDLEGGVIAEANNDGSIYVDKSVKKGSPLEKEAIAHEKVHLNQMERGDLNYDDDNVYWKGKSYPRSTMNEGAKKLPWEKEAYDKTEHMNTKSKKTSPTKMSDADLVANNKQTHKKFLDAAGAMPKQQSLKPATETKNSPMNMKATPITYKSSALKRTIAAKEFMKTYGGESTDPPNKTNIDPPKKKNKTTKSERVIKGNKVGTLKTTETSGTKTTTSGGKDLYDGSGGYMANRKWQKWYDSPAGAEYRSKYTASGDAKPQTVVTPPTKKEKFTPEQIKRPGTPGEEGTYQMGYWEASNLAAAKKGMYRNNQKQNRKRQRDAARFDRQYSKGKTMYDAGGNPIPNTPEGKAGYLRSQASTSNPNFLKQVGLVTGGTTSSLDTIEDKTPEDVKGENLRNVDLKAGLLPNGRAVFEQTLKKPTKITKSKNNADDLKAVRSRSGAQYNATNKSESAFKMGGYGSKKNK